MRSGSGGLQASFKNDSAKETIKKTCKFSRGSNSLNLSLGGSRPALDNCVKEIKRNIRAFYRGCGLM